MALRLDWCGHDAAKYAVEHWHYSRCMPSGKLVRVGAWEDERFIGAIMYGLGATPMLCRPYGLAINQVAELVRVALAPHKAPVSRMMAISLKMLRKFCPGLRIVVSFADTNEGHHGGIYQATNWIYAGRSDAAKFGVLNGKVIHPRTISEMVKRDPSVRSRMTWTVKQGKHRYLMPLDDSMRAFCAKLAQPYPKRAGSKANVAPVHQTGEGGVTPTPALHLPTKEVGNG